MKSSDKLTKYSKKLSFCKIQYNYFNNIKKKKKKKKKNCGKYGFTNLHNVCVYLIVL